MRIDTVLAKFPKDFEHQTLANVDVSILSYHTVKRCRIVREIVYTNSAYDLLALNLTSNRFDFIFQKVGGTNIYERSFPIPIRSLEQIFDSPELMQIFKESSIVNVVKITNFDTDDSFVVNTEGRDFAYHVGRIV